MTPNTYPQAVTEDENDLGFQPRVFDGLWEYRRFQDGKSVQPVVVAKILSSFEILVKTFATDGAISFTHQRYGHLEFPPMMTKDEWHPASGPYTDAAMFIHQYEVGLDKLAADKLGLRFIPGSFSYRDIQ
jgi:hypothetical protein